MILIFMNKWAECLFDTSLKEMKQNDIGRKEEFANLGRVLLLESSIF